MTVRKTIQYMDILLCRDTFMFVGVVTQDYVNIVFIVVVSINKNKQTYVYCFIDRSIQYNLDKWIQIRNFIIKDRCHKTTIPLADCNTRCCLILIYFHKIFPKTMLHVKCNEIVQLSTKISVIFLNK